MHLRYQLYLSRLDQDLPEHHQLLEAVFESAFLTLDLEIAKPDAGWCLYYACLPSVIAIFPNLQAKAALD